MMEHNKKYKKDKVHIDIAELGVVNFMNLRIVISVRARGQSPGEYARMQSE